MNPRNFFAELRRRNVIRMAGLYLVGAWLLIQVASTVLPTFDVPSWALRGLIITLALGFIPALIFSWVFELTPQGLKRDAEVTLTQTHEDAMRIQKGELDANAAFMQGRIKVTGNMAKLLALLPITNSAEYKQLQTEISAITEY